MPSCSLLIRRITQSTPGAPDPVPPYDSASTGIERRGNPPPLIMVFKAVVLACRRLYSLLSRVISSPFTLPHPFRGMTMQVQLSCGSRSSANFRMACAALVGSLAPRVRSHISWLEMSEVRPSVTRTRQAKSSPAGQLSLSLAVVSHRCSPLE